MEDDTELLVSFSSVKIFIFKSAAQLKSHQGGC